MAMLHAARENSITGSQKNIQAHYDLSNEMFKLFLSKDMNYSAGDSVEYDFIVPEDRE